MSEQEKNKRNNSSCNNLKPRNQHMKKKHAGVHLLLLVACVISGCSSDRFHGRFFDDVEEHLKAEFVDSNRIGTSSSENAVIYPMTSQSACQAVFYEDYELEISYDEQFVIVFSFVSIYQTEHYLKSINVHGGNLSVKCGCRSGKSGTGSACAPYQRWCMVKMDIVDFETVSFKGE